jgi:hypothetical protein
MCIVGPSCGHRNFVNVINRKNTDRNLPYMMAVLGFASFCGVKLLLPKWSFCLRLYGTEQDSPSPVWFVGRNISNRSNPLLCAPRWICVTDRVARAGFSFGAISLQRWLIVHYKMACIGLASTSCRKNKNVRV